jgi:hypothetical protein
MSKVQRRQRSTNSHTVHGRALLQGWKYLSGAACLPLRVVIAPCSACSRYFNVFDAAPENERQSATADKSSGAAGAGMMKEVNEFFT